MSKLDLVKSVLEEEDLLEKSINFEARYDKAVNNMRVKELMDFETPQITDLTDILEIEHGGKLCAIRDDLHMGVDNHKKPVVGGLILRGVLHGSIPREKIDTLVDGGNYNSAKALKYYAELFEMKGMYIMSRLHFQSIVDSLTTPDFEIIRAPKKANYPIEREFYEFLFEKMKHSEFRRNKYCLWHARYSGKAMYPFGRQIAARLNTPPDYVVSCLGAGSTLQGVQIAIQDYFKEKSDKKPGIIVAEHELSPLFIRKGIPYDKSSGSANIIKAVVKQINPDFYKKVAELPHIVIGPHYNEINPLLPQDAIDRIDKIIQYTEHDWMSMQKFLQVRGISVGNSSAANLNVAVNLANKGYDVLTIIFEPFREFYKQ
jgi:hypothetical protein